MTKTLFCAFVEMCIMAHVAAAAPTTTPASCPCVTVPSEQAVLNTLKAGHPRLMLSDERLSQLKEMMKHDEQLAAIAQRCIEEADKLLTAPRLEQTLHGPRMLHVTGECNRRAYVLGLAYRLTGKREYADNLRDIMLTVCDFTEWNIQLFLDVAEMSHGVGIGYDWIHDTLDEPTRLRIRQGLIKHGLDEGIDCYTPPKPGDTRWKQRFWVTCDHNWNTVCHGGMIIGALAIADTDPQYARQMVPKAVENLPNALTNYGPDGAWGEGVGYWTYATRYAVFAIDAMQTSLGTDFGLSQMPALDQAGFFPLYLSGPTGQAFNFADADSKVVLNTQPCLRWLAARYGHPEFVAFENSLKKEKKVNPALDFIWYQPQTTAPAPPALDRLFRGHVPVAVMRSNWNSDGLFLAAKAGFNAINHSHLDIGSFVMDALGQRWVRDLGKDDYNLPGYWFSKEGGQRWTYYRLNSLSHNVITIDGRSQLISGTSQVVSFQAGGDKPSFVIDMTNAYIGCPSAKRGVAMVDNRRAVLVQDELEVIGTRDIAWGITTDATIAVDGTTATLELGGQKMVAKLLAPEGAIFLAESAHQEAPQKTNDGISRLMIRLNGVTGEHRIAVLFSPVWPEGQTQSADVVPLENWSK